MNSNLLIYLQLLFVIPSNYQYPIKFAALLIRYIEQLSEQYFNLIKELNFMNKENINLIDNICKEVQQNKKIFFLELFQIKQELIKMVLGQVFSFFSQQVMFIWLLVFITPLFVFLASVMAKGLQILYQMSINRQSLIYKYLGDVSWLFPFKQNEQEFKLVHIVLLAVLIGLVSLIILGGVMLQNQTEKQRIIEKKERKEEKTKKKVVSE
ncbi:unnamed protein product (macronuclear) [Paramecium tetraurelia]|uniref:Transmembrane protein n=1 Tax=Paramecium tetraurelia TaxID=5888 RepID=A0DAR1_PARTE|nr:uncharacterized protein GSPATT00015035001 [Paramecium tetraurelia]CAK80128.1 unnamed protein product [Paramecium tetraurelia]|eukprot:XP_001447525.1 hypothetical protein (macronuclear) [Paramecium tetraurelia strain d4-2]